MRDLPSVKVEVGMLAISPPEGGGYPTLIMTVCTSYCAAVASGASLNYLLLNRRLRTNEAHRVWMAICSKVSHPDLLADPKQNCHLVLRGTAFAHKEDKKYLKLVHISL